MLKGLLALDSRTGALLFSQRFVPAYGLSGCEQIGTDDIRLSAMLFALYLHSSNVVQSDGGQGLVQHTVGAATLRFCLNESLQLLLITSVDTALGAACVDVLSRALLAKFEACFATQLSDRLALGKRSALKKSEFAAQLLDALMELPSYILARCTGVAHEDALQPADGQLLSSSRDARAERNFTVPESSPMKRSRLEKTDRVTRAHAQHLAAIYSEELLGLLCAHGSSLGASEDGHGGSVPGVAPSDALATSAQPTRTSPFASAMRMLPARERASRSRGRRASARRPTPRLLPPTPNDLVFSHSAKATKSTESDSDWVSQILFEAAALRHGDAESDAMQHEGAACYAAPHMLASMTSANITTTQTVLLLRAPLLLRVSIPAAWTAALSQQERRCLVASVAEKVHAWLEPLRLSMLCIASLRPVLLALAARNTTQTLLT